MNKVFLMINSNFQVQCLDETNQDIGRIRVIETESGIEVKYHITDRERFFSQYSLFAIKTAQSTVEMCRVVFEAKEKLSREGFLEFCTDIGHKGEDSTIRKYLAIGAAYERLIQYADKLPNSWTSIYTITQIPSETFNALAQVGESFAKLSGNQIKALVEINSDSKKAPLTDATSSAKTTAEVVSSETPTASSNEDAHKSLESNSETSSEVIDVVTTKTEDIRTDEDLSDRSTNDESEDESVGEDAKVKTNALLERMTTTASISVKVDTEDEFEPYKLLLCFNSQPSDEATLYLMDCINTLKSKFKVDIELKPQEVVFS
jgi:hypothetical protein